MPQPLSEEKRLEWKNIILKQQESGLSISHWCKQNNFCSRHFYYWREKLFPTNLNQLSFTKLSNVKEASKTHIILECKGVRIYLDRHFDPVALKRCLAAIGGQC